MTRYLPHTYPRAATAIHHAINVTDSEMRSHTRHATIVVAKRAFWYLLKQESIASYPEIAEACGRNNHSTIITGCRAFQAHLLRDDSLPQQARFATGLETYRELWEKVQSEYRRGIDDQTTGIARRNSSSEQGQAMDQDCQPDISLSQKAIEIKDAVRAYTERLASNSMYRFRFVDGETALSWHSSTRHGWTLWRHNPDQDAWVPLNDWTMADVARIVSNDIERFHESLHKAAAFRRIELHRAYCAIPKLKALAESVSVEETQ